MMPDSLSVSDLDQLLLTLDPDRERAAERYLELRSGLESFFEWRDCEAPEELTDIVIDRVTKKIVSGERIENIGAFSVGVAKFVVMEYMRKSRRQEDREGILDNISATESSDPGDVESIRGECLKRCLAQLPKQKRDLLIEYFDTDEETTKAKRKSLAETMGINLNSLRIRVSRLKSKLEKCTTDCCTN